MKDNRIFNIADDEIMTSGHLGCPGCGAALSLRLALKALGRDTIVVVPACCVAVMDGPFPMSAAGIPLMHTAFETAASAAAGVRAALEVTGREKTTVLAWAGDGATFDIGFQAVSASAVRNDDFIYACYDNEAYMNTGIQQSSATPKGAWTTTTLEKGGRHVKKKDIIAIMAAHEIPYIATATVAFPDDLAKKLIRAKEIKGFKFLHILSPCPPGHKFREQDTVKVARLAVLTGIFPLFEVFEGKKYVMSMKPDLIPVEEYLKIQNRFSGMTGVDIQNYQYDVKRAWVDLLKKDGG